MFSTQISIPSYQVSEELYNSSRTIVYRGYREADSLPPYPGQTHLKYKNPLIARILAFFSLAYFFVKILI
jgi:hypothetical protein